MVRSLFKVVWRVVRSSRTENLQLVKINSTPPNLPKTQPNELQLQPNFVGMILVQLGSYPEEIIAPFGENIREHSDLGEKRKNKEHSKEIARSTHS